MSMTAFNDYMLVVYMSGLIANFIFNNVLLLFYEHHELTRFFLHTIVGVILWTLLCFYIWP